MNSNFSLPHIIIKVNVAWALYFILLNSFLATQNSVPLFFKDCELFSNQFFCSVHSDSTLVDFITHVIMLNLERYIFCLHVSFHFRTDCFEISRASFAVFVVSVWNFYYFEN